MNANQYLQIKQQVETLQKKAEKAEWELEKLLEQLRETYNCETVEQAEELLDEKTKQLQKMKEQYEKEMDLFLEQYGELLDQ